MSSDAADPIHVLDEMELAPGVDVKAFVAAFRSRYQVLAETRGMVLEHLWVTPPEGPPSVNPSVVAIWALEGVPGFWRMRSQNADPEVAAWWAECDRQCVRRSRRFAVAPDALGGFAAAGRRHA